MPITEKDLRNITVKVRLSALEKTLEEYNCLPVITVAVSIDTSQNNVYTFSLDSRLTVEENLTILETAFEALKSSIANGNG